MTYLGVRALQRAGVRAADVIVRHADIRPADLQPTKRKVMALGKSKPLTRDEALVRMAGLCARSEQCASDIARKLRTKGLSSADIASVIDELKERSFLDEARYARSFARDKVRFSAWGRRKIRMHLLSRRIPEHLVVEAFESVGEEDYAAAAARAARQKAASLDLSLSDDRIRLYRHLLLRGFESDVARSEIRRLMTQ